MKKITLKEKFQILKIGNEVFNILKKDSPNFMKKLTFNTLEQEYARKVMDSNFNYEIYKACFIDKSFDDYVKMFEENC